MSIAMHIATDSLQDTCECLYDRAATCTMTVHICVSCNCSQLLSVLHSDSGMLQDLVEAMNAHLRLHFVNDELADQKVLSIYPTTLRRRALRHLYLQNTQM